MQFSAAENMESIISNAIEHFLEMQLENFDEKFFKFTDQWERGDAYLQTKEQLKIHERLFLALSCIYTKKYTQGEKIITQLLYDLQIEKKSDENLRMDLPEGISLSIENVSNRISITSLKKLFKYSSLKHNLDESDIELAPLKPDAYLYFREGLRSLYHYDYDMAEKFFNQALDLQPDNLEFRYHKVIAILNEGFETEKALQDLRKLEIAAYRVPFVKYGFALSFYENQYYDQALSYLDEAISNLYGCENFEEKKLLAKCYYLKGRIFQNYGLWEIALNIFANIPEFTYPIPSSIHFQIGRCLEKLHKIREALQSFEIAATKPRDLYSKQKILERSARCYYMIKEYEMALIKVKQAIHIATYCFESRLLLVEILVTKKDYLKAEKAVKQLISSERAEQIDFHIKMLLGDLMLKNHKYQKAKIHYEYLLEEYADLCSDYLKLQYAITLYHLEMYEEAISQINQFLKKIHNINAYGLAGFTPSIHESKDDFILKAKTWKVKALLELLPPNDHLIDYQELNELAEKGNIEAEILLIKYATQKTKLIRNRN